MKLSKAIVVLLMAGVVFSPPAHAQHQQLTLLEDYYDPAATANAAGGSDWANVTVQNMNRVYTGGASQGPVTINGVATTSAVFTVRAMNGSSQTTAAKQFYWTKQDALEGEVVAMAADPWRIYAVGWTNAGVVGTDTGGTAFSIRAYDAKSGTLVWQEDFVPNPPIAVDCAGFNRALSVTVDSYGRRLYVAGVVENQATGLDFVLRAYNAKTGQLKFMKTESLSPNPPDPASPPIPELAKTVAVSTKRDIVIVGGTLYNLANDTSAFSVRAYQATTGTPLWADDYVPVGSGVGACGPFYNEALAIAQDESRCYVAGTTKTVRDVDYGDDTDWTVRAYLLNKGTLKWSEDYDRGTAEALNGTAPGGNDGALAISLSNGILYVAGYVADKYSGGVATVPVGFEDEDFGIRVYYASTGKPMWWDYVDGGVAGGGAYGNDRAMTVAVNGRRVYVGGYIESLFGDRDAYTVSYPISNASYTPPALDPITLLYGNAVRAVLNWDDLYDGGGGGNDVVSSITSYAARIFSAGSTENADGNLDFTTVGFVGP